MEDTENVAAKNAPAAAMNRKKELCECCHEKPVVHRFEHPHIAVCCQCMDMIVENSGFVGHEPEHGAKPELSSEQQFWREVL